MNSPRKRNLTEELESVLRAHSLDAPAPASSIENILARTVGSAEAADASDAAAVTPAQAKARRRWLAPNRLFVASIAGAAAVAALISVPMMLSAQKHSTSTSAADGPASERAALGEHSQNGTLDSAGKAVGPDAGAGALAAAPPGATSQGYASQFGLDASVPACAASDLSMDLVTAGAKAPSVASIRLTNTSGSSCLVSGFPQVQPIENGSTGSAAQPLVAPEATPGAVAEAVPTLVLAPGTTAEAAIDGTSARSSCDVSSLLVTLPDGQYSKQFAFASTTCAFQVHPLVAATK